MTEQENKDAKRSLEHKRNVGVFAASAGLIAKWVGYSAISPYLMVPGIILAGIYQARIEKREHWAKVKKNIQQTIFHAGNHSHDAHTSDGHKAAHAPAATH